MLKPSRELRYLALSLPNDFLGDRHEPLFLFERVGFLELLSYCLKMGTQFVKPVH